MGVLRTQRSDGTRPDMFKLISDSFVFEDDNRAILETTLSNPNGESVDVQHPLPSDGDAIYSKDIWVEQSITTDWVDTDNTGNDLACIPFTNLHTRITNSTGNAVKTVMFHFNRTVNAHQIGLGCVGGGDFSNVKITLLGSGNVERGVHDDSLNNTKYTSRNYKFPQQLFNAVKIEFNTTDAVCISNCTIQKTSITESSLTAKSELTEEIESVSSFRNALQVDTALVHKQGVNLFFFQPDGANTTIATQTTKEDVSIDVADATGFTIGDKLKLTGTIQTGQSFMTITNIVTNTIYLDRPIGSILTVGTDVEVVYTNMNINGSLAAPEIFKISPPSGALWQLTRIIASITDASSMDDGKFGGIVGGITNGVNLRVVKGDGTIQSLTNWKKNGDLALDMFDVTYVPDTLGPSGLFGLRARWTFTKAEFIVELDGTQGDYLELRVQDDLSVLDSFEIKAQGRLFGA